MSDNRGIGFFGVLLVGSFYFLVHFLGTTRTTGSGNDQILIAWSIRRGVIDLGLYLAFLAVVFGAYFFLKREVRPEQPENRPTTVPTETPAQGK